MENEITFRTSVGGYRRDEVIEYVESMNEQIFCLKKESEEAAANYKARIHELETLLVQKEANEATLIEENGAKLEEYETENAKLKEDLEKLEEQYKAVHSDVARLEAEKRVLKEKLGREVLRLRTENQDLKEKLQEAMKMGVHIVIATGRDKGGITFVSEPLGLENGNHYVAGNEWD